ncbi:MAG: glycosyl hydrolase, partial [Flavobacteriales bacterium]
MKGFKIRQRLKGQSLLKDVKVKNIGPTIMGGRVVDIDANPENSTEFYVAYASGGLWKTENNGLSFDPVFDEQAVMTIGDIAVNWDKGIIWVGTGENNSSRSSYSGTGIYKKKVGEKKWSHKGLPETHHVGRIVLHPEDEDIIWVAAIGHLYTNNPERGVYKTTDGGKTWKKTLFINDSTGCIDLIRHPNNPEVLYTAAWERERKAWDFKGNGKSSGIYKSVDGGENWTLLTKKGSGFPHNKGVGRIGLAISKSDPRILYAQLDNQNRREKEKEEKEKLSKDELRDMEKKQFLDLKDEKIENYLRDNHFPMKYNTDTVRFLVKKDSIKPIDLVYYIQDANQELFDTPVKGAEIYKSENGGKTWDKTHKAYLDDLVNSYGYYFGQIRVSPYDPNKLYTAGVPLIYSEDGGKTFRSLNKGNVHVDHHAIWVNPNKKGHLIIGNDGGINITYDNGKHWRKANTPPVGQFYSIDHDNKKNYFVYGGMQDNGVWKGPNDHEINREWVSTGNYAWEKILGGDGMQVEIDTRNNHYVYAGFQFGNYYRINQKTGKKVSIKPQHELGERPFRFNWQTPIHLSEHNQDVLYMGSNKFHRSMNKGEDFKTLSKDLTKGGVKGSVPYGSITMIHESPLKFGLIYVGTDDGLIHVSEDGGYTWKKISKGLPND